MINASILLFSFVWNMLDMNTSRHPYRVIYWQDFENEWQMCCRTTKQFWHHFGTSISLQCFVWKLVINSFQGIDFGTFGTSNILVNQVTFFNLNIMLIYETIEAYLPPPPYNNHIIIEWLHYPPLHSIYSQIRSFIKLHF